MARPKPCAEPARYAIVPGILACRVFLKMRSGAADLAAHTQPRAENLRRSARRTYSPRHRLSEKTTYTQLEMKMPRHSLTGEIDYALRTSARDSNYCQPGSIAPLHPSKDRDAAD